MLLNFRMFPSLVAEDFSKLPPPLPIFCSHPTIPVSWSEKGPGEKFPLDDFLWNLIGTLKIKAGCCWKSRLVAAEEILLEWKTGCPHLSFCFLQGKCRDHAPHPGEFQQSVLFRSCRLNLVASNKIRKKLLVIFFLIKLDLICSFLFGSYKIVVAPWLSDTGKMRFPTDIWIAMFVVS